MKILIIGGDGFVGSNIKDVLRKNNKDIYSLSKRDGFDLTNEINSLNTLRDLQPDIIVNCAANVGSLNYVTQKAADVFDSNMRMLLNLYRSVKDINNNIIIINPVANCSYPGELDFYTEDKYWDGPVHRSVLSYGSTRRMIIILSECYMMQFGIRSINYIVPNMYGPYDSTDPNKAHALNALAGKIVKARFEDQDKLDVWGTGKVIREWLYAGDFGRIILETINNINKYLKIEPVNIGQKFGITIKELVELMTSYSGFKGSIQWITDMPDGAPKKVMDDKKFRSIFTDFKFTEFREGISNTVKYYESVYPY